MNWRRAALALCAGLAACSQPGFIAPETASGWTSKQGVAAQRHMVAAANPLAADAGLAVLRAGGSALDAAIAIQMVLGLVEPQASGIGGGAFLLHWDGQAVAAWDGRETAPAAVHSAWLLGPNGKPLPFAQAVYGGRAVATPGLLKMLQAAHQQHGVLPWARLMQGAITLAEQGFAMSPRLQSQLASDPHLRKDALARAYFYAADGQPHPVGHVLRNPAYAAVLRAVAQQGSAAFYGGDIAADLVRRVREHAVPGAIAAQDLAAYTPMQRQALCSLWLQRYRVCGFPPPSSGHIALMQMLGMLEVGGTPQQLDTETLHRYSEAARLAYADRALYVADPAFVSAPGGDWMSLLAPSYLRERAALIGPRSMGSAKAGNPGAAAAAFAPMPEQPEYGTSHISVVDAQGRAVAMTTTIEAAFGARVMADGGTGLPGGYLLNNQMTDFSFLPTDVPTDVPTDAQAKPVANRIEPGKRPRSSMSPTLVFDAASGQLLMTVGSPGGPAIPHFVAKTLLGSLAWGRDVQRAIDLPNFGSFNGPTVLETGRFAAEMQTALRERGHVVQELELTSGLQAIQRRGGGWFGGADPRREGSVRGD
jgi:gamma-glutamyltranspeptidase / glutathione hydrolase